MSKMNRTAIYNVAIKQFRNLGRDSDGKWRYEESLNKTCFDLFGKKGIATKLAPKSKISRIEKCIASFDFDAMIGILADNKASHSLRVATLAKQALASGKYNTKEIKTIKKSYKKIIENLTEKFQIEKASDDLFAELNRVVDDYDDDYEYDFDDDNIFSSEWEDDDGPVSRASRRYGSKAKHKNELARLIYGGSKYDDDDEDDDVDEDNITKIVNVLESLSDRLDSLEAAADEPDEYIPQRRNTQRPRRTARRYSNPAVDDGWEPVDEYDDDDDYEEDPIQLVRSADSPVPPPPTPVDMSYKNDMATMMKAIADVSTNVITLSKSVNETSQNMSSIREDLTETMKHVTNIMRDLYEPDAEPPDKTDQPVYPIRDSDKS